MRRKGGVVPVVCSSWLFTAISWQNKPIDFIAKRDTNSMNQVELYNTSTKYAGSRMDCNQAERMQDKLRNCDAINTVPSFRNDKLIQK